MITLRLDLEWPWHEPPPPRLEDLPPAQAAALAEYRRYVETTATARLESVATSDMFKERKQLHRVLETHTWIFGEEFALTVSDQSLTEVLRKHRTLVSGMATTLVDSEPELRVEGSPRGGGAASSTRSLAPCAHTLREPTASPRD